MTIFLVNDNNLYTVSSGDIADFHKNLPAIKHDLMMMKWVHPGKWQNIKRFERPKKWLIREVHGITNIIIYSEKDFKEKKKDKETLIDREQGPELVPFIRVPDAHGILLCRGENFDFEGDGGGERELWDPYEGQGDIRENYPYAPDVFTLDGKDYDLNHKIKSPKVNYNMPKYISKGRLWGTSPRMGFGTHFQKTEDPVRLEYEEAEKLYGGFYYPEYEWMDSGMPGAGYYDIALEANHWFDFCEDDGNWQSQSITQVSFKGNPVGPQGHGISVAVDHDITSVGDSYQIMAWGAASNMTDIWGCIIQRQVFSSSWFWYPGMYFCGDDPLGVGTIVGEYSGSYYNEFRYIDSFGANKLLDTQDGKNGYGYGFVKLYIYGTEKAPKPVFCFNFYTPVNATNLKIAGLADNGKVTLTDISTLKDKDGNVYTHPYGQNHLGIVSIDNFLSRSKITLTE